MRLIAVTLPKGGVGKTTTAVNLAHGLALGKHRVLLVDCDTQNSATTSLGFRTPEHGLADFVLAKKNDKADCIIQARENLWLLAGGYSLLRLKNHIAEKPKKTRFTMLRKTFSGNGFQPIDFVIFDLAPGWDHLSMNVLAASTEILTPVSLEELTLRSFPNFVAHLKAAMSYNEHIQYRYIVPTFLDRRVKKSKKYLEHLRSKYPRRLSVPIRYNVKLSEAPEKGQTIFEYSRRSAGCRDYSKLCLHVLKG